MLTYLSAPFFAVFMLRDLQLSYVTYMALQVCSSFASLVALPLWGKHADLVGNVRVLRLALPSPLWFRLFGFCLKIQLT